MPHVIGSTPGNHAEAMVLEALKCQAPADWWVLASPRWSLPPPPGEASRRSVDGEADFVVLLPALGIAVLEVKATREIMIDADGRWWRRENGRWVAITETPFEQAARNVDRIKQISSGVLPIELASLPEAAIAVYPRGQLVSGNVGSSRVVFSHDLGRLAGRIREALPTAPHAGQGLVFGEQEARAIARHLANHGVTVQPTHTASDTIRDAGEIEAMTAMQSAALEGIFRHRAVAVTGPAGSGKTILAMRRLVAFREAGMNAVYVCFNKRLAEYLGEANPSLKDCIWSVDSLFVRVADRRPQQSTQDLGEFFQEVLPGHVVDVAAYWEDARKYDAIVVDEGQDFGSSRLIALHQLLKDDGRYVYFADGRQDLYAGGSRADLGVEVAFRLVHNCRNTRRIVELANHVSSDSVPHMPGAPDGDSPVVSRCANTREMAKVAWQIAARWIGRPCRVAILSPYTLERSCMAIAQEGFNLNLARELGQWTDRQPVLFSTIRSFKGLEADAVVLVDIDELAQKARTHEEARAELYVAVTRGRTSVAMLCLDEATKASLALEI